MNTTRKIAYVMFLAVATLFSCDILNDDELPTPEELLELLDELKIVPGHSMVFDLKQVVQGDQQLTFEIRVHPTHGSLKFLENTDALLEYYADHDFVGQDQFSIEIYSADSLLLDADTVTITAVAKDNIPCFNGALSDYYWMEAGREKKMEVLENDGYCEDQVTDINLSVILAPTYGQVEVHDEKYFKYHADAEYEGHDFFIYLIELTDNEGNTHMSLSIVSVETVVKDPQQECIENAFSTWYHQIWDDTLQEAYEIKVFNNWDETCEIPDFFIDILEINDGTAEVSDDNQYIIYRPAEDRDSTDWLKYMIAVGDDTLFRSLSIYFKEKLTSDPEFCPTLFDDYYTYDAKPDSVGDVHPLVIAPLENDHICIEDFEMEFYHEPNYGTAVINDDHTVSYTIDEDFTGTKEVEMKYKICEGDKCDYAYIHIEVNK
ncbi:MAG: hypothetical protein JXQ90_00830 [Cyclobacteriaceae bacterium]